MKRSSKPSSVVAVDKSADEVVAGGNEGRSLEHIRAESLRVHRDAVNTILELESWRDEIDATIAFLKAQKR